MRKEEILAEIKRTAKENGGKPLGKDRFEEITGIKRSEWQKFWPRISEAQQEAGLIPNQFSTEAHPDDYLIESIVGLIRELKKFPTQAEMRIKRLNDSTFPDGSVFTTRFGNKLELISQVRNYCRDKTKYSDIIEMLDSVGFVPKPNAADDTINKNNVIYGFVYLVKGHPGEYKIGRTNMVDRRLSELGATASIEQKLVHEIKTDDPAGVEAYWHKRFQVKRMKGEWFKLNAAEVNSFKRWRRIY